ncbi:MaoC family dehydratase [Tropicibacter sp. R16_0]|uniref:MaoC family dehydratase n=1 Tax=Tropicibacter sp. R16_0 TaxID=2821102 RepID=UPI001ADA1889|nr:MaoC family dehydratase [Tropicibacter sp. R16_0]MBO9449710.1 MaoC family dehydratase [Tropicibacter sp. R16_0]
MSKIDDAVTQDQQKIGTEIGVSDWITVDQAMIDQFATVTHDEQWIHVDPERAAAETPFGGTIAHGFLSLSLASRFAYECLPVYEGQVMGINYGFNKIRFLAPVKSGSRLRGRFVLRDIKKRSATEIQRETGLSIEIEGSDTPALVAEWLSLSIFE